VQQKSWSIVFGVMMAAAAGLFVVAPFAGWWLPANISSFGGGVDNLFYLILAITGFFFILTEGILVYAMYKFSDRPADQKAQYMHGNHKLEMFWTAVPAAILLLIALLQIRTWEDIKYRSHMPAPDQIFEVSARQFEWRVRHPAADELGAFASKWKHENAEPAGAKEWARNAHADDLHVVNEIHTWKDANTRFYLTTRDVLHSFYLPNLRLKQDAVPGKIIPVWFKATESNGEMTTNANGQVEWKQDPDKVWDLVCAELCGWGHYKMIGRLYVHKDREDYDRWVKHAEEEQNRRKP
jgi:cytochrome c oxidase subunit 2